MVARRGGASSAHTKRRRPSAPGCMGNPHELPFNRAYLSLRSTYCIRVPHTPFLISAVNPHQAADLPSQWAKCDTRMVSLFSKRATSVSDALPPPTIRVLILGDASAGKTAITELLVTRRPATRPARSTAGCAVSVALWAAADGARAADGPAATAPPFFVELWDVSANPYYEQASAAQILNVARAPPPARVQWHPTHSPQQQRPRLPRAPRPPRPRTARSCPPSHPPSPPCPSPPNRAPAAAPLAVPAGQRRHPSV